MIALVFSKIFSALRNFYSGSELSYTFHAKEVNKKQQ